MANAAKPDRTDFLHRERDAQLAGRPDQCKLTKPQLELLLRMALLSTTRRQREIISHAYWGRALSEIPRRLGVGRESAIEVFQSLVLRIEAIDKLGRLGRGAAIMEDRSLSQNHETEFRNGIGP